MLESFYTTRRYSDIFISKEDCNITKIFNNAYKESPDYDYYHLTNDDTIYHTPGWDVKLAEVLDYYGGGISYGNDLLQGKNLPTFPMISANIVKILGWLQMPKLEFLYGDMVWRDIGIRANCLYYIPEVIIEHKHVLKTKETDSVYEKTNSGEQYKKDRQAYVQWLSMKSQSDVEKVNGVIDG